MQDTCSMYFWRCCVVLVNTTVVKRSFRVAKASVLRRGSWIHLCSSGREVIYPPTSADNILELLFRAFFKFWDAVYVSNLAYCDVEQHWRNTVVFAAIVKSIMKSWTQALLEQHLGRLLWVVWCFWWFPNISNSRLLIKARFTQNTSEYLWDFGLPSNFH